MERKAVSYNNIKLYKEGIIVKIGIYPGSFDPITKGHLDLMNRAAQLVDKLIVVVLVNPNKSKGLLTIPERIEIITEVTKEIKNIEIDSFSGLLVEYASMKKAQVIFRGLRSISDFDMEQNMAQINKKLSPELETVFLMTAPEYACISSSSVRELIRFNGEYEWMLPEAAAKKIKTMEG